ncbi:B12-binding domain-containing radical SAM protein [Komagataeibacter rhaeticus]|uniref:B12-binding domain-containing radical SAM protein n=1 Tax=Komagataeibacter rhaeticus TaxID=215221 RepID=A0A181CAA9_9PROT|nr:B12-binding domain-containing radical SAM protein [Komagataeibacter rhaeticus]ATU72977.1 B12-binding domain-containing radical SAM protein [Komagataeibacter xylinus]QIP35279.1 B12-binding domain-containing radical SAM protein [Komagataeibacter rhaeticus]QOC47843.1 B12-binding domain-containing radical SAM protein [Komagataeibacter rhaeticus]WPP22790.1 B12-binding domain-containing radical SAM protein [Komagataeibacter rhaeticus]SAY48485.1 Radical SAM superfamily protein [Komagataeibacter rh
MSDPCKVLMVFPLFNAGSFWNYMEACDLAGARYPAAPLGLVTVAALLPAHWEIRLVNRNTEQLEDADFDWADLVMTGGMLPQRNDALRLVERCRAAGKPVVVGGPDVTSSPDLYARADFQVLGEAEEIMGDFIATWRAGIRHGVFTAAMGKTDVTKSPLPRFDLLKLDQYLHVGVQFSRGCPFSCEFCDIIELYGRVPRTKTNEQVLAELDALYALGYRGHVDFVDDNLIGNKKALRKFLPGLKRWQEERNFPFEFSTEASINLADDADLLRDLAGTNFFAVFIGIESPDTDTLVMTQKKQNTRRSLRQSIETIHRAGIFVNAGFIVGFDSEKGSIAAGMIDCIEDTSIPVCMVGLLYALPTTQLTRRLRAEGRLFADDGQPQSGDQCTAGLNFETARPRRDVLDDYRRVLAAIYDPVAYFGRVRRLGRMLRRTRGHRMVRGDLRSFMRLLLRIHRAGPGTAGPFWRMLLDCALHNPRALPYVVMTSALYLHLGPFSRQVIGEIDREITDVDAGRRQVHPPAAEAVLVTA